MGNVLVSGQVLNGIVLQEAGTKSTQGFVLLCLKTFALQAFEFNANGVIVAVVPSAVMGHACVPGFVVTTDHLNQFALSADEKVGRDLEVFDAV